MRKERSVILSEAKNLAWRCQGERTRSLSGGLKFR